jgi:hypothetical protein
MYVANRKAWRECMEANFVHDGEDAILSDSHPFVARGGNSPWAMMNGWPYVPINARRSSLT